MSNGKTVWLSDDVLEWIDEESREYESPNEFLKRISEDKEIENPEARTDEEIKELAEEKFFELQREM